MGSFRQRQTSQNPGQIKRHTATVSSWIPADDFLPLTANFRCRLYAQGDTLQELHNMKICFPPNPVPGRLSCLETFCANKLGKKSEFWVLILWSTVPSRHSHFPHGQNCVSSVRNGSCKDICTAFFSRLSWCRVLSNTKERVQRDSQEFWKNYLKC